MAIRDRPRMQTACRISHRSWRAGARKREHDRPARRERDPRRAGEHRAGAMLATMGRAYAAGPVLPSGPPESAAGELRTLRPARLVSGGPARAAGTSAMPVSSRAQSRPLCQVRADAGSSPQRGRRSAPEVISPSGPSRSRVAICRQGGRVAQWESARFTRERSLVRNQPRPSSQEARDVRPRRVTGSLAGVVGSSHAGDGAPRCGGDARRDVGEPRPWPPTRPARTRALGAPMSRERWMALSFAVGSVCFLVGPFPGYTDLVGERADAVTFFAGSIFFTLGGALQTSLALRRRHGPGDGSAAWRSATVQSAGTLFFNVSTFRRSEHGVRRTLTTTGSSGDPMRSARSASCVSGAIAYRASLAARLAARARIARLVAAGGQPARLHLLRRSRRSRATSCPRADRCSTSPPRTGTRRLGAACFLACAVGTLRTAVEVPQPAAARPEPPTASGTCGPRHPATVSDSRRSVTRIGAMRGGRVPTLRAARPRGGPP